MADDSSKKVTSSLNKRKRYNVSSTDCKENILKKKKGVVQRTKGIGMQHFQEQRNNIY